MSCEDIKIVHLRVSKKISLVSAWPWTTQPVDYAWLQDNLQSSLWCHSEVVFAFLVLYLIATHFQLSVMVFLYFSNYAKVGSAIIFFTSLFSVQFVTFHLQIAGPFYQSYIDNNNGRTPSFCYKGEIKKTKKGRNYFSCHLLTLYNWRKYKADIGVQICFNVN